MTDLAAVGKFHLAHTPPPYCASCYGQYPERRHVDFSADYDGPVLKDVEGGVLTTIDELIVCEDCLASAAQLIGLEPRTESEREIGRLRERLVELNERLKGALEYVATLERAQQQREALIAQRKPPQRKG